MLKRMKKEEIEQYVEYGYALSLNPAKSAYPAFFDGIQTKEDYYSHLVKSTTRKNYEAFVHLLDGKVNGLIQFFYLEEDKYLQLYGFSMESNTELALDELLEYISCKFKGYEFYFGFPEQNQSAIAYLKKKDFHLIENSYHDIFLLDKYETKEENGEVIKIGKENFSLFTEVNEELPDAYWNNRRIYESLEEWNIFVFLQNGKPRAAVMETGGEIFGLSYQNHVFSDIAYRALLGRVFSVLKAKGVPYLVFFNDEESQESALALGFVFIGKYILYKLENNF